MFAGYLSDVCGHERRACVEGEELREEQITFHFYVLRFTGKRVFSVGIGL